MQIEQLMQYRSDRASAAHYTSPHYTTLLIALNCIALHCPAWTHLRDSSHLPPLVSSYSRETSEEVAANSTEPSTFLIDTRLPVKDIIWALRPNSGGEWDGWGG